MSLDGKAQYYNVVNFHISISKCFNLKSQRVYVCLFDKLIIGFVKKNTSVKVIKEIFLKKGKVIKTCPMRYQKCYIKDFLISGK